MRGLEKKIKLKATDKRTLRLLDKLGPEGRVRENQGLRTFVAMKNKYSCFGGNCWPSNSAWGTFRHS